MFTIKHVIDNEETLYATDKTIRYTPGGIASPPTVWYAESGPHHPLTGGIVYVMSSAGATVARYDLRVVPDLGPAMATARQQGLASQADYVGDGIGINQGARAA